MAVERAHTPNHQYGNRISALSALANDMQEALRIRADVTKAVHTPEITAGYFRGLLKYGQAHRILSKLADVAGDNKAHTIYPDQPHIFPEDTQQTMNTYLSPEEQAEQVEAGVALVWDYLHDPAIDLPLHPTITQLNQSRQIAQGSYFLPAGSRVSTYVVPAGERFPGVSFVYRYLHPKRGMPEEPITISIQIDPLEKPI